VRDCGDQYTEKAAVWHSGRTTRKRIEAESGTLNARLTQSSMDSHDFAPVCAPIAVMLACAVFFGQIARRLGQPAGAQEK